MGIHDKLAIVAGAIAFLSSSPEQSAKADALELVDTMNRFSIQVMSDVDRSLDSFVVAPPGIFLSAVSGAAAKRPKDRSLQSWSERTRKLLDEIHANQNFGNNDYVPRLSKKEAYRAAREKKAFIQANQSSAFGIYWSSWSSGKLIDEYVFSARSKSKAANPSEWLSERLGLRLESYPASKISSANAAIDAFYFNARWNDESLPMSWDGSFQTRKEKIPAQLFKTSGEYASESGGGCTFVRLPFAKANAYYVVGLPDKGFDNFACQRFLSTVDVRAWVQGFHEKQILLNLPRVRLQTPIDIKRLAVNGLKAIADKALNVAASDFEAQQTEHIQVGSFEINEFGSVPAPFFGLDAFVATPAKEPLPVLNVFVTRPFLYLVVDRAIGLVLFAGRVDNPFSGEE